MIFNRFYDYDVSLCVCPVIDHKICHNIGKVAVDPSKNFGNVMTKFIVNNRTDARKTDVNLFFYDNRLSALAHRSALAR